MTTMREYSRPVINQSGYELRTPNVGHEDDYIQSYPANPYAESAAQLYPLGTKLFQGERGWWYCKNGAVGLNIAAPTQSAVRGHAEMDDDIVVGAASAAGTNTVTLTSTANLAGTILGTKDALAEGYLYVNDAAGEGQAYKIKGHEALSSTDDAVFTLYDALTIALTTSSQVGLIQNPCANVVISAATVTSSFAGIPLIAVTASYYFWAQMAGPCPCIPNAAIALGTTAIIGTTAGAANPAASSTTEIAIGYPMTPGVTNTETFMVMLTGNW